MKHCPECSVEYIDTAIKCSDWDVELTFGPAIQEEHPDPKIETVYATEDPALVALVKSLLEDTEIECFTRGYEIQDLIGCGRLGGLNIQCGPVEFAVAAKDVPTARELLAHLDDAVPDEPPEEGPGTYLGRSSGLGPRATVRSSRRIAASNFLEADFMGHLRQPPPDLRPL